MFSFCSRVVSSPSSALRSFSTSSVLASTKKGGGSSKNNRNSAGKRLGVKKYHGELVQPGSIIIRQRGFKIHPGQHVTWGRDHTLTSLIPGFVKFYKMPYNRKIGHISANIPNALPRGLDWDPPLPPTNMPKGYRSYVGVTFGKEDVLPRDEMGLGRERVFLGRVDEGQERTGVYEFEAREVEVDLEGGEEKVTKGRFQEKKAKKIEIPRVPGRVVNGEIVPGEVVGGGAEGESAAL